MTTGLKFPIMGSLVLAASASMAEPLRGDHPLIGTWRIDLAKPACHEIYRIYKDGTSLVTSAQEVAQTEFVMSDQPDVKGYYKWVDKLTRDNGKKDCMGETTQAGHEITNYIFLLPSKDMFLMCEQRDLTTCIGPFVRIKGNEV